MSLLTDPFSYDFMRYGGGPWRLAFLWVFSVRWWALIWWVQRMGLLGDVVAHAVLPGLAIAHFFQVPLTVGAFVFGMASTFATSWIRTLSKLKVDTAMAITFLQLFLL